MTGDAGPYLDLITPEHQNSPRFIATVSISIQPHADAIAALDSLPQLYDLDTAVGVQLDAVGVRVGVSRDLTTPLVGVYFAFDTFGVGWDQGTWQGEFDPTTGLIILPDDAYRILIRATIAANQWDGTIPGAYDVYSILYGAQALPNPILTEGLGLDLETEEGGRLLTEVGTWQVLIQDYQDMTFALAALGRITDAVTQALFQTGAFGLRPAGVRIEAYLQQSVIGDPYFGFDVENLSISGFDVGCWAIPFNPVPE